MTTPAMPSQDPKGLYSTLGVPRDADEAAIRKAYRRLALRCHPDKNQSENATEEFQKIANAYEVLSDPQKRSFYDSTGCVDEEEMDGFMSPDDLFAAFFGGGMAQDLDEEEQAMLDEFLKFTGAFSFKAGSKKKGKRAKAQAAQQAALEQAFLAAMTGMPTTEPTCPTGHALKKKKADGGYECDVCQQDIADGKRFFDCRKCDFSMCVRCHKNAEAALMEEAEEEEAEAEIFEAFCEMNIHAERQGRSLRFRCKLCNRLMNSQQEATEHLVEQHEAEFEMVAREVRTEMGGYAASSSGMGMPGMPGMGPMGPMGPMPGMGGLDGLEAFFGMMEMGAPPQAKGRRQRRKR